MASKIKISQPSKVTGLNISQDRSYLNSDEISLNIPNNLLDPGNALGSSAIIEPPKGPDGKYLIKDKNTSLWRPKNNEPTFTFDEINEATDNGKNVTDVMKNGLKNSTNKADKNKDNIPGALALGASMLLALGKGGGKGKSSSGGNQTGDITAVAGEDTNLTGQQLWQYKVKLFNHTQEVYEIPANAIKQLYIEEDLLSWPLKGYIIIDGNMEAFERSEDFDSFYFLRSDARDVITIEIKPIIDKGILPDEVWTIELEACIYDVEDLEHSDFTNKQKKLYFWDKKYQELNEKKIQWCTATGERIISDPCPKPESYATDLERSMFTGEAIASLLSEAGYAKYIDSAKWDMGKGKILFNTKPDWTVWDCIQYILNQQISNDDKEDICLFIWNRGDKKWNLIPMWQLFKEAGSSTPGTRQIEHLFFEENITEDKSITTPFLAPIDLKSTSKTVDIKSDDYNKIMNYRFSQFAGLDNSRAITSRPVYAYRNKRKQFSTDIKENEISSIKKSFKNNYVSSLLSKDKSPIFPLNRTKTDNINIHNVFSPVSNMDPINDRKIRSGDGIGKVLFANIFMNSSLSIRLKGSTHRIAGTFVGVDRINTTSDTFYDYQLCGQYLNVNVKHIIQDNKYVNDMTMVKVHSYKELPYNEGVT